MQAVCEGVITVEDRYFPSGGLGCILLRLANRPPLRLQPRRLRRVPADARSRTNRRTPRSSLRSRPRRRTRRLSFPAAAHRERPEPLARRGRQDPRDRPDRRARPHRSKDGSTQPLARVAVCMCVGSWDRMFLFAFESLISARNFGPFIQDLRWGRYFDFSECIPLLRCGDAG